MTRKKTTILSGRARWTLCLAALFFAATLIAEDAAVVSRDAWVRLPVPSKTDTALYVVLENRSAQRRAVVSASSDAAQSVEMHEMKMDRSVMRMTPVSEIGIPAKGKTSLNPNGLHLMLFGLRTKLAEGDTLKVTLKLDDGTTVPVTATVRK